MTTFEVEAERPPIEEQRVEAAREERCPTCGTELPAGFRFCGQCGRALAATLAPAPGQRLTIAFLDLEGFTSFASRVEENEVRELIGAFHAIVREQVDRHGGFEVKQLGDGFMLAFSDPARAIACAADVQRMTAQDPMVPAIRVCAGLNSGDAIRHGDDFFGHTVNVASRIVDRAAGGQVLLSKTTRLLADSVDGVRFVNAGRRRLRGLRGRHRLFEAVYWE
ncbi:MAG: zinc-ribbon domain-containing protein [Chloroflexi bacterium]|nr:zinc-ribbon domain-containing protein [Chloroflexota bacterium]